MPVQKVIDSVSVTLTPYGPARTNAQLRRDVDAAVTDAAVELRQTGVLGRIEPEFTGKFLGAGEAVVLFTLVAPVVKPALLAAGGYVLGKFAEVAVTKTAETVWDVVAKHLRKKNLLPSAPEPGRPASTKAPRKTPARPRTPKRRAPGRKKGGSRR